LLPRTADPNVVDATGQAAMTYAATRGFLEIVRRLLDAGVDAKFRYDRGLTALMWAAGREVEGATTSAWPSAAAIIKAVRPRFTTR
jgi:ankyrin repeat protein